MYSSKLVGYYLHCLRILKGTHEIVIVSETRPFLSHQLVMYNLDHESLIMLLLSECLSKHLNLGDTI